MFQAMRPVFNDLLTEIQRSIGYFTNIDRNAKIERVVALGQRDEAARPAALSRPEPGLRGRAASMRSIASAVPRCSAPRRSRRTCCASASATGWPCRGWGLGRGTLTTNLLPKEIVKDRFIRSKKPWAVAAAALLLLGCTISYASLSSALGTVAEEQFKSAEGQLAEVASRSSQSQVERIRGPGRVRQSRRASDSTSSATWTTGSCWLELLRAINQCLPSDPPGKQPKEIAVRNELHVTSIDCQQVPSVESLVRAGGEVLPAAAGQGETQVQWRGGRDRHSDGAAPRTPWRPWAAAGCRGWAPEGPVAWAPRECRARIPWACGGSGTSDAMGGRDRRWAARPRGPRKRFGS